MRIDRRILSSLSYSMKAHSVCDQAGLVGHFTLPPPGANLSQITLTHRNKQGGDVLIAFAVLQVFSFSMFWGPTPWVYLGESFPLRVRPKCIALGSATSKVFAYSR